MTKIDHGRTQQTNRVLPIPRVINPNNLHISLNTKLSFGKYMGLTASQVIDKGEGSYFFWMRDTFPKAKISKQVFKEINKHKQSKNKNKNSGKEKYSKKMWSDFYDFINKKGGHELLIEVKEAMIDYLILKNKM
jgi:hypothetical protein